MKRIRHVIKSELDIHFMKNEVSELCNSLNIQEKDRLHLMTILFELAYNQIKYAKKGFIETKFLVNPNNRQIIITATDKGPGIKDVNLAIQDNYSTGGSLGLGLPGVKRMADKFEIITGEGQGTTIKVELWISS